MNMAMRDALVIGAGLAGAAVCERLCARGWRVTLIERHAQPAMEASGNHAGSFHPLLARDANRMARLTDAGVAFALGYWRGLEAAGLHFGWSACGALQLSRADGKSDPALALARDTGSATPRRAQVVAQARCAELAGVAVASGGVFFEDGGWVQPRQLVAAQLARCADLCGARFVAHFGCSVAQVRRVAGQTATAWEALDSAGARIAAASVVVVAGGASSDAARWFGQTEWPIDGVRGRLTLVDAGACAAPRLPVHRDGYVLPAIAGRIVVGASYECSGAIDTAATDRENLRRLAGLLQCPAAGDFTPTAESRSATRAVARDRLPVIGALPDTAALTHALVTRKGVRQSDLPRLCGVYVAGAYGSRGLTWAALGGEVLASMLEGTPPPLEGALLDAIDPARFAFRALRRAQG